ncbi:hypothetical protein FA15DRAFT_657108 [Coprinopsis marcescibilis]|uniref:Uncharacterized protein n=1 Tax=Coprinopsis marcescibilis TaxID=230819 RepID=A0A5C3KQQ2_COPMA|nr:hypothetical protein FA15DRAFT_657108 [Coprinopsis marcescibilis]
MSTSSDFADVESDTYTATDDDFYHDSKQLQVASVRLFKHALTFFPRTSSPESIYSSEQTQDDSPQIPMSGSPQLKHKPAVRNLRSLSRSEGSSGWVADDDPFSPRRPQTQDSQPPTVLLSPPNPSPNAKLLQLPRLVTETFPSVLRNPISPLNIGDAEGALGSRWSPDTEDSAPPSQRASLKSPLGMFNPSTAFHDETSVEDRGRAEERVRKHREGVDYFTSAGQFDPTLDSEPSTAEEEEQGYTLGHPLQRMPGKVKGFNQAAYYHHKMDEPDKDREKAKRPSLLNKYLDPWQQVHLFGEAEGGDDEEASVASYSTTTTGVSSGDRYQYEYDMREGDWSESSGSGSQREEDGKKKKKLWLSRKAFHLPTTNIWSESGHDVRVLLRAVMTQTQAKRKEAGLGPILDAETERLLHANEYEIDGRNLIIFSPEAPLKSKRLAIKQLPLSSPELLMLLELNHSEVTALDPTNHVPGIMGVLEAQPVDIGELQVFLVLGEMEEFDVQKLDCEGRYFDLFRQLLEGLAFLRNQRIGNMQCSAPGSFMVQHEVAGDGTSRPRYLFVDFSAATRVLPVPLPDDPPESQPESSKREELIPGVNDMYDLGTLFARLIKAAPGDVRRRLDAHLTLLVQGMTEGGFTVDECRVLFEMIWSKWRRGRRFTFGPGMVGRGDVGVVESEKEEDVGAVESEQEEEQGGVPGQTVVRRDYANAGVGGKNGDLQLDKGGWVDQVGVPSKLGSSSNEEEDDCQFDGRDEDSDHPNFYYDSDPCDSDNPEGGGESRSARLDEDQVDHWRRGRAGTIIAKVAIPAVHNLQVVEVEIKPYD